MAMTETQKNQMYQFFAVAFNAAPGVEYMSQLDAAFAAGMTTQQIVNVFVSKPQFTSVYPTFFSNSQFATKLVDTVVRTSATDAAKAEAVADIVGALNGGMSRGDVIFIVFSNLAAKPLTDAKWGGTAKLFANEIAVAKFYTEVQLGNTTDLPTLQKVIAGVTSTSDVSTPAKIVDIISLGMSDAGRLFTVTSGTVGGADVMRLTGDQDVRIDFSNPANQVKGLDLDGNGVIANNGVENAITGRAANFEIVDAYSRNPLNEGDRAQNFLGDISFDGTGFGGDGVSTDGNIFLGGLGADTAFGGIGNDFMTGGGIAAARVAQARAAWLAAGNTGSSFSAPVDTLSGGRNADFFFVELSALDATDGNRIAIDGGNSADDSAAGTVQTAQDADWLLFEGSDDDEPVHITLRDDTIDENGNGNLLDESGSVVTRSGQQIGSLWDIENFDASGSLYGFLNGVNVEVGGAAVDSRVALNLANNNGIGSSAQLRVTGSDVANIIIGGYDNDRIDGNGGNDLLAGGNLAYLINPNLVGIVNDGRDEIFGGAGNDDIVFEADGGRIEGDVTTGTIEGGSDTLWLTSRALGTQTAADLTTDNVLRFDLDSQNIDTANGYGGADSGSKNATADDTQDQTNYKASATRVTVQDMENVIATGLGAVDYDTDGTNTGDIAHLSRANFAGYQGNLTLRGTSGANILYANTGDDVVEGRQGNDSLSGGAGNDDFIFALGEDSGDGVDVIHRQVDANNDGFWDGYSDSTRRGTFDKDFGAVGAAVTSNSMLTLTLVDASNPTTLTGFPVNGVVFQLGGIQYSVSSAAMANTTYAGFTAALNAALDANPALVNLNAVLNANNTITITDPAGQTFVAVGYTWVGNITPAAGNLSWNQTVGAPTVAQAMDRLIYQSYEDRLDGEKTDDDAITGSTISLGQDAYAQDLVVNFAADGTRIAEDQSYTLTFANLTTQDTVTVTVNGVQYRLQVGVDLDGNSIAAEDGLGDTQVNIQAAFLTRLTAFINSFMDDDTAAGKVSATLAGSVITLRQAIYNGEETVFMTAAASVDNASGGEVATVAVANTSQHEVHLLNYDGRNAGLNAQTVLFLGDTGTSQAVLATAATAGGALAGSEADVVDGGADDLAGIANNTATNASLAVNFSVHGDDLLIGGAGNDTITAGTGDDRVIGSLGADVIDGGKDYYAVQILGEAEARVVKLNTWEATHLNDAAVRTASGLTGLVISSATLIPQSQTGNGTVSGLFNDTLQFQQADFTGGNARFTVTLSDFNVAAGGVVELRNGGAGTVGVDSDGNGTIDSTTTFTNFENIRTVSGTGLAVAGNGQGNDTLNVVALSNVVGGTGGITYNLTNNNVIDGAVTSTPGEVRYSTNAIIAALPDAQFPQLNDYESLVMKVDGVENVISGTGADLLLIDETEAAKNNTFTAGAGIDRIQYMNAFVGDVGGVAEPTVTIKVDNVAASVGGTDTVTMTAGRVGTTMAVDTLGGVEFIQLSNATAQGSRENDLLDVTSMTTGAVVSYIDGTVKDLAGVTHVTIQNIFEIENIWADGNDTVLVADADIMSLNARSDAGTAAGTNDKDIAFATFIDFDTLKNPGTDDSRKPFLTQTTTEIEDVINANQFNWNLSKTGTGADSDTVDYSNAQDNISVVVELDATKPDQFVIVDSDGGTFYSGVGDLEEAGDRVDHLVGVERIVAAQGESVLDLSASTKGLEIKYSAFDVTQRIAATATLDAVDVFTVRISDLASASPLSRTFVELRASSQSGTDNVLLADKAAAAWTRIEGSDNAETVILNSVHSLSNDTFNLRGGTNAVKYNELTRSINLSIGLADALGNGIDDGIRGQVTFTDGNGAPLPGGGTHVITSYAAGNKVAAGSLRIAASQDAEDSLSFDFGSTPNKLFILGKVEAGDDLITVNLEGQADSIILTGFEILADDPLTNDVFQMDDLLRTFNNLTLVDDPTTDDHDVIRVPDMAADDDFNGGFIGNTLISLQALNTKFNFDFDVLDITPVTLTTLTTVNGTVGTGNDAVPGSTDELVMGAIRNVTNVNDFEALVLTDATIDENGTTFVLNTATNTLTAGTRTITFNNDMNGLSFGGTVFDDTGVAKATKAVTVTVAGTSADATILRGGDAADTITGAGGADNIRGGKGNDTLSGGFAAEITEKVVVTLPGGANVLAGGEILTVGGITIGVGQTVVVAAGADADQIGSAFVTWANANKAFLEASLVLNAGDLGTVSYDGLSNNIIFSFTSQAQDVAAGTVTASVSAGTMVPVVFENGTDPSVQSAAFVARAESADTYVFEATAALNGVDTLNNVDASDLLDFSAFGVTGVGAIVNAGTTVLALTNGNAFVGFNQGTALVAADLTLADNSKAVVLLTADADGAFDATNNAYSVYFVANGATAGTGDQTITLVGTINSAAELSALQAQGLLS